jgi:hypothetical protein
VKYPLHIYLLLGIAVASAIAASSGDWGVGFVIGVAITIALTENRKSGASRCL